MYEFACNYDPDATIEDNASCEFGTCPGCTDPTACNFNPIVFEDGVMYILGKLVTMKTHTLEIFNLIVNVVGIAVHHSMHATTIFIWNRRNW